MNPGLGVTSLYKDLYKDENDETFILYQSYMGMTAVLVPIVSTKLENYSHVTWLMLKDNVLMICSHEIFSMD